MAFDLQAYRRAYKRTPEYRAYENGYRAELRRRGLCRQCGELSPRYSMCLSCRQKEAKRVARRARMRLTATAEQA